MRYTAPAAVLLLCSAALFAQNVVSVRAGIIGLLVGEVFIDGRVPRDPKSHPELSDGQQLLTRAGAAELMLGPYAVLWLAENSALRLEDARFSSIRFVVERGSALLEVLQKPKETRLFVGLNGALVEPLSAGLYRLDALRSQLRVHGGEAAVSSGTKTVKASRGRWVQLQTGLESGHFDTKVHDLFHGWAAGRSFQLFQDSPETRKTRNNWNYVGLGWFRSRNFEEGVYLKALHAAELQQRKERGAEHADGERLQRREQERKQDLNEEDMLRESLFAGKGQGR